MVNIGTPFTSNSTKIMLLGSGELGKEVLIELQRYGAEVIAVDRYENAPAMQVAHRSHVIDMLSADELRELIRFYLENEEERKKIASKAKARVLKDHTSAVRFEKALGLLS